MRFMVIVKANEKSEAGQMPSEAEMIAMGKLNAEMMAAGVMLSGDGLLPSSKGSRVKFTGSERTVLDGPFAETKELVAGFWVLKVKSKEEVLDWVSRIPFTEGEVEVRQIGEVEDYEPQMKTEAGRATLAAEAEVRKNGGG
ncbi:YciI family protein [soil metagenome]